MKRIIFCLLFIVSVKIFNAQTKLAYLSYVFPKDSLAGFHEMGVNNVALRGGYFGIEYKVFMYRAKRNFINKKYGYSQSVNEFNRNLMPVVAAAPCSNIDFEASPSGSVIAVSGWTISEGSNTSSCSMGGCCPTAATGLNTWIRTTPFVCPGPVSITIPNSPLGGSQIIQLNNEVINAGEIVRLEQTFTVTPSNILLQYAYMCMLDASGHACCDNPYLNVLIYDCSNTLISAASTSIVPPNTSCSGNVTGMSTTAGMINYYNNWQVKSVNLSSYIGTCIKIQVTVSDCDGWAHAGYAYFDAKCSSYAINVNGTSYAPGGNINLCGSNTATLTAPLTYTPVQWTGPPGSGIVADTNAIITTTTAGIYTLTTGAGTNSITSSFTLNLYSNPSVSLTPSSFSTCVSGANITLVGSPSGGVYSGLNVLGNVFSVPSTAGTYSVVYTYTDTVTTCTNSTAQTLTVNLCTGINSSNYETDRVKLYPNPNNGEFIIQSKEEEQIIIQNELGQTVRNLKLNNQNNYTTIITGLSSGIYFATGKNFKEKIIVTK